MGIEHLVQEVEEVFRGLEIEINNFKQWSGLHCKTGCIKCCLKPDIEATVLEFIPFAYTLYKEGSAAQMLERLTNSSSTICNVLDAEGGKCSRYAERGMICRLFGYSSRITKHGNRELVTCTIIKTEQSENYKKALTPTATDYASPVMSNYYMQLRAIDNELGLTFYPINTAIKKALETVLHYFAYREDAGLTT